MKRLSAILILFLAALMLSNCRPPELEGAVVDFNAGRFDNALANAETAVEKYPDNAEAWFYLGRIYGKKDRMADMMKAFERSLALAPTYESQIQAEKSLYFSQKFNAGVNSYNKFKQIEDKKSEAAEKALRDAIENFQASAVIRDDYTANRLIAVSYQLLGDKVNAISRYEALMEIRPDTADVYVDLGSLYFFDKEYDKATGLFEKALEVDPENLEAATFLAQAYDVQKKTEQAIVAYKRAVSLNPEEKAMPFNLGLLLFNEANKKDQNPETKKQYLSEAATYFGKALAIDDSFKEGYQLKGQAELLLERYADAKETYLAGLDKFPEDSNMWYNLGVSYARLNDKAKAEEAFAKAEELEGQ